MKTKMVGVLFSALMLGTCARGGNRLLGNLGGGSVPEIPQVEYPNRESVGFFGDTLSEKLTNLAVVGFGTYLAYRGYVWLRGDDKDNEHNGDTTNNQQNLLQRMSSTVKNQIGQVVSPDIQNQINELKNQLAEQQKIIEVLKKSNLHRKKEIRGLSHLT